MTILKQNKGEKIKHMTPKHRVREEALKPNVGSTAVRFEGTVVKAHGGVDVTHPSKSNAGSHDHKVRLHGGDD
jgi:hypothetical protein